MALKVGHKHVDQSGLVYLPYLHEWSARSHNLVQLCAHMSSVFGAEPPVSSERAYDNGTEPSLQWCPKRNSLTLLACTAPHCTAPHMGINLALVTSKLPLGWKCGP